jgi:hypothetical protein
MGYLSRGVTIPGATVTGGRGGTTDGGRGGRPVGSGSAGDGLAGGRGRGGSSSPSSAPALSKDKGVSVRVIHDDEELSSIHIVLCGHGVELQHGQAAGKDQRHGTQ